MPVDQKTKPIASFAHESKLWSNSTPMVAGIDEAGRGPWAGPVVAAAVIFPPDMNIELLDGVRDSKAMTKKQRSLWAEKLKGLATAIAIGVSSYAEIDSLGIVPATKRAMLLALADLKPSAQYALIDAVRFESDDLKLLQSADAARVSWIASSHSSFIKGEQKSLSIAAASIIAKTTRDQMMINLSKRYPLYGFEKHKGYGTKAHWQALLQHGPCHIHRKTFKPIKKLLEFGL